MIAFLFAAAMAVGPVREPYAGEVSFCLRFPADCTAVTEAVAPESWLPTIREMDDAVNHWISPMSDQQQYGRAEYWNVVLQKGRGDCEDYALTKRHVLMQLGVPAGAMYLIRTSDHMRLGVHLPGRDVILDNPGGWRAR